MTGFLTRTLLFFPFPLLFPPSRKQPCNIDKPRSYVFLPLHRGEGERGGVGACCLSEWIRECVRESCVRAGLARCPSV